MKVGHISCYDNFKFGSPLKIFHKLYPFEQAPVVGNKIREFLYHEFIDYMKEAMPFLYPKVVHGLDVILTNNVRNWSCYGILLVSRSRQQKYGIRVSVKTVVPLKRV